ncbi:MAG: hypothetical protein MHM6MM_001788 [Cercozoa sp. M6MM]
MIEPELENVNTCCCIGRKIPHGWAPNADCPSGGRCDAMEGDSASCDICCGPGYVADCSCQNVAGTEFSTAVCRCLSITSDY